MKTSRRKSTLDYLKQVIELDPSYVPGLFSYSQILYRKGFYPEALNAFKKYLTLVEPDAKDYERYATLLYFNKMYKESLEAIEKAPDNLVTESTEDLCFFELGEYVLALESATKFFGKYNQQDFITQDYVYYAQILNQNKNLPKLQMPNIESLQERRPQNRVPFRKQQKHNEKAGDIRQCYSVLTG